MYVKLIYNGVESEWTYHSRKQHKRLMKSPPDYVVIHISDFYPDSPDKSSTSIVDFQQFTFLARECPLRAAAQLRQDNRHLHTGEMDETDWIMDVEKEIVDRENIQLLKKACQLLTPKQFSRFYPYHFKNLTLDEIAQKEHVNINAIHKSILCSLTKLKKYFSDRV